MRDPRAYVHVFRPTARVMPRGRAAHAMGASIWQTPGGVQEELNAINTDVLMFSAEIAHAVKATADPATVAAGWFGDLVEKVNLIGSGAITSPARTAIEHANNEKATADLHQKIQASAQPAPTADPKQLEINTFYLTVWLPFVAAWRRFYDDNKSWSANFWWNHAPEAEQYLDQLREIRAKAKSLGVGVNSPEPHQFAKSLLFDPGSNVVDKAAAAPGKIFDVAKVAIYGGLAIGGLLVLGSLASNLRSGKDPATPYLALARRGRGRS